TRAKAASGAIAREDAGPGCTAAGCSGVGTVTAPVSATATTTVVSLGNMDCRMTAAPVPNDSTMPLWAACVTQSSAIANHNVFTAGEGIACHRSLTVGRGLAQVRSVREDARAPAVARVSV